MQAQGKWYCEQIGVVYDWPVSAEAEDRIHDWKRAVTASNARRADAILAAAATSQSSTVR